ncbi:hypothetical protein PYCCODRAFT_1470070 [Trametes coccinea BRFM310]|uniref:Inositol polyphosphate-related phosphatase domain-containing protein n=1 Tax=Trametes coccinea (strain BRFM310) TaxID=1353009 RepID=A0A1Y2IEI7_TRAC3|nr:hypothetical protein PYCCODRAFT_1470070 [Trametes coccinea BRFM310]
MSVHSVALLVFGRDDDVGHRTCDVKTGPLYMGNKGAVGVHLGVPGDNGIRSIDELYTFVCAYLIAYAQKLTQRIQDYRHIVHTMLFPSLNTTAPTTMFVTVNSHFGFSDLNFRLALPPLHAPASHEQPPSLL